MQIFSGLVQDADHSNRFEMLEKRDKEERPYARFFRLLSASVSLKATLTQ